MTPSYITAIEHQTLSIGDGTDDTLSSAEADQLMRLAEMRPGFCQRGYRSIRLAQHCGLVQVGSRMLEVLPKVARHDAPAECRRVLLNLLRESPAFPVFRQSSVGHHLGTARLLDIFIAAFFDEVSAIVQGGLLRQYRELEEDLPTVRGRIAAMRQFAACANRPDRVACVFDDLTADNIWNRFVKAAVKVVRPWIAAADLRRRWSGLIAVFDEVRDVALTPDALRGLTLDRQAARYTAVVNWARWILALLSPQVRAGAETAPGLLFDMNLLFQSAVGNIFRRQYDVLPRVRVTTQETGTHLGVLLGTTLSVLPLQPDILVRRDRDVVAIADTKWKRVDAGRKGEPRPHEVDAYQMTAYGAGFRCHELILLYPWVPGLSRGTQTDYELSTFAAKSANLRVILVDCFSSPPGFLGTPIRAI